MSRVEETKSFLQKGFTEFKAFIQRGNVVDLAVAVIIGAAFGKIVTSLVTDIISPLIGVCTSAIYGLFSDAIVPVTDPVLLHLGAFLRSVVDFLIVAFCVFLLVKAVNAVQKRLGEEAAPKPAEPTTQEKLLTEIRDLLKAQQEPKPAVDVQNQRPSVGEG